MPLFFTIQRWVKSTCAGRRVADPPGALGLEPGARARGAARRPGGARRVADRRRRSGSTRTPCARTFESSPTRGLVSASAEERNRRGRPRLVYEATAEPPEVGESAGYRLLAEILASHLAGAGQGSTEQAERAGEAWGRYLVDRKAPNTSSSAEEDIQAVVRLLEEFGFEPSLEAGDDGHTLLMQHCPFGEVADSYRKIVCSVHLGLMQGALAELGAHVEADRLTPFVRPGVCAAHLEEVAYANSYDRGMCRNIRTLHNFEPPASEDEVRAAALQYVRKISGFTKPSRANEEAFEQAVDAVAAASTTLLDRLVSGAPPEDRELEAAKARARAAARYAA